ncbi:MAG: flagellar motor protein MotB [Bacteroidetes bacterium GWF2_49_14]|nr:MAG: flagellar motor protein MotB [Bacteroidetes bacterium GWF2_49_14]
MKLSTNNNKGSRILRSLYALTNKSLVILSLALVNIQAPVQAQVQEQEYTTPSWWFGVAGGANFTFYRGSVQELNSDLTVPTAFRKGFGIAPFVAPLIEFHKPNSMFGFMLQAGFDSRAGAFKQVLTPCNCPADLSTNLGYLSVEPSLRFSPFKSGFYFYAGPRVAFNIAKSFTYTQEINPEYPDQVADPEVNGKWGYINKTQLSMQIGAGYDMPLETGNKNRHDMFSPFVSFQPYFGQSPRSIETWNLTTLRFGAALKFGHGHKIAPPVVMTTRTPLVIAVADPVVKFSVNSPKNIVAERTVRETFPLRNYIFFSDKSTGIPSRYVLLRKDQVKDFKEDQVELYTPKDFTGRSKREMVIYYNILNILGDRMGKNPSTTIKLVGSSANGPQDGRMMAESVKDYLVTVFEIDAARITVEGRDKPKIPSEQPGGTKELDLLREGDQRVSIESSSPVLLMEFQAGPDAPLRPVEIRAIQQAPLDSYVTFHAEGAQDAFTYWSLEIMDEKGEIQRFGPFQQDQVSIPGKSILGTRQEGTFTVTMIGLTKSGKTIKNEAVTHMVLWNPTTDEEGMRFSIIYEFNDSKAIVIYEKYITDIIIPKIPKGGTVIIHGYTDIIGDESNNLKLSLSRANDVKQIFEKGLAKAGRSDVKFEVYGFGEDKNLSPFDNRLPEERFYNRTVIIDIIPGK